MSILKGKHILVGITGGIAAYKTLSLIRLLIKDEAEVRVLMTPAAHNFVTPLTISTLSQHPACTDFADLKSGQWHSHIEMGLWADLMLIAPLTANTLAKIANGLADNILTTTYLSARCPVMAAPSMDMDMYRHTTTRRNIEILRKDGVHILEAQAGFLASGLVGEGRMPEPEQLLTSVRDFFLKPPVNTSEKKKLDGKTVLITAGPTYEALDPVRFIGNHSSGKMGFALAEEAAAAGARVILVTGPSKETIKTSSIERIDVVSAQEMFDAVTARYAYCDVAILSAAVADFRPKHPATEKIKKAQAGLSVELEPTPDILAHLGKTKSKQFLVGFALETQNEIANATAKLKAKNLDLIVLNSLRDSGAGFSCDTNIVTLIDRQGTVTPMSLKPKAEVAADIIRTISEKSID